MSMKKEFISSTKWNAISTLLTAILGLVQLWALSHILDEESFGIISAAMVFISIIGVFTNFGIGNTIIRTQNINIIEISSIFIFGIFLGFFAWAVLYFSSEYISSQLHSEKLNIQLKIASISLIFLSLGQCHKAALIKQLKFRVLSLANLGCTALAFLISIAYAWYYKSPVGVAVGFTISNVILCIIYYIYARNIIEISAVFSYSSIKKHLNLCFQSFIDSIMNAINLNIAPIVVGKIIGIKYLGGYNIANTLSGFTSAKLLPVLYQVLFPSLSKIQNEEARLKKVFLDVSSVIYFSITPMFIGLYIIADPLIKLFFDEKWYFIVPVVKILSVTYYFRCICGPYMSVLILKGKIYLSTISNLLSLLLFTTLSYLGGKYYGVNGVALGFFLSQIIVFTFILYVIVYKCIDINILDYLYCVLTPLIHCIPMVLIALFINLTLSTSYPVTQFTIILFVSVIIYCITIVCSPSRKSIDFKKIVYGLLKIHNPTK